MSYKYHLYECKCLEFIPLNGLKVFFPQTKAFSLWSFRYVMKCALTYNQYNWYLDSTKRLKVLLFIYLIYNLSTRCYIISKSGVILHGIFFTAYLSLRVMTFNLMSLEHNTLRKSRWTQTSKLNRLKFLLIITWMEAKYCTTSRR